MLKLFTSTRAARTPNFCRRLELEALEDRTCPAAPQLSYNLTEVGGQLLVQGTVLDENPQSVSLNFSGAAFGGVSVNSNGTFTGTLWGTPGNVTAQAWDSESLTSGPVDAAFSSQPPSIDFTVTWGANKEVTVTGRVTDESPSQTSVSFGGAFNYMLTPSADGTFSFTTTASYLGTVYAFVSDPFGQSEMDSYTMEDGVPTITNFQVSIAPGRFYTFSGVVNDLHAAGLTVSFGGLMSLSGRTVAVAENGTFSLTIQMPVGEDGEAQACVTDWWGQKSEVATLLVV